MRPLDFLSHEFRDDPWPVYSELRERCPVGWFQQIGMVCVSGHADVRDVLTSAECTVEYPFRVSEQVFGRTLLDMDGPEHRRLRGLLSPLFARENVQRLGVHLVEPVVDEVLAGLHGKNTFDFMTEVAEVVPLQVICRFLQIPADEVELVGERLAYLLHHLDGSRGDFERASATRRALESQLTRAMESAVPHPAYRSAASLKDVLDPAELQSVMMLLLAAGVETSVCAFGNTLCALFRHPAWLSLARSDAAALNAVVLEALRWEPPQHDTVRFARDDSEFHGVAVRAGQPIKVLLASANRDPESWEAAGDFKPERPPGTSMTFGFGNHMCLGRAFAVLELTAVLRALLARTRSIEPLSFAELHPVGNTFRRPPALRVKADWAEVNP